VEFTTHPIHPEGDPTFLTGIQITFHWEDEGVNGLRRIQRLVEHLQEESFLMLFSKSESSAEPEVTLAGYIREVGTPITTSE